jgi:hypothetical protein
LDDDPGSLIFGADAAWLPDRIDSLRAIVCHSRSIVSAIGCCYLLLSEAFDLMPLLRFILAVVAAFPPHALIIGLFN